GGGIAARLCRMPGASDVLDRAWVTYSNAAKAEEVGVDFDLLEQHGAVSEAVVCAMAEGGADKKHICIAVSGIAGPGGGTDDKPVGTVWIAVAMHGQGTVSQCLNLSGARYEIQSRSVIAVLKLLLTEVKKYLRAF
ncbi:MAG: CinA family protein, partial [Mariprofundus sp.]